MMKKLAIFHTKTKVNWIDTMFLGYQYNGTVWQKFKGVIEGELIGNRFVDSDQIIFLGPDLLKVFQTDALAVMEVPIN